MKKHFLPCLLLLAATLLAGSLPVQAAANKSGTFSITVPSVKNSSKDESSGDYAHTVWARQFGAEFIPAASSSKFTKKMAFSARVLIPTSVLASTGDEVILDPYVHIGDYRSLDAEDDFYLKRTASGKFSITRYNTSKEKKVALKGTASAVKKGSYYIITITNEPMKTLVYNAKTKKETAYNTSTTYKNLYLGIGFQFNLKKNVSSKKIYIDHLELAAKKTLAISFDTASTVKKYSIFRCDDGELIPLKYAKTPY